MLPITLSKIYCPPLYLKLGDGAEENKFSSKEDLKNGANPIKRNVILKKGKISLKFLSGALLQFRLTIVLLLSKLMQSTVKEFLL